jgi:hypothetical protein
MACQGGGCNSLSPLRQSAGVMEWWSNGVMKGPIQIESRAFAFSNTPILQYSTTARNLYRQSHGTLTPAKRDLGLAPRIRFAILNQLGIHFSQYIVPQ